MPINYDPLGRVILPKTIVEGFKLDGGERRIEIRVNEKEGYIIMNPTDDLQDAFSTGSEISEHIKALEKLPSNQWRFVREMDTAYRVVLPGMMRRLLRWTTETNLEVTKKDGMIYIQQKC